MSETTETRSTTKRLFLGQADGRGFRAKRFKQIRSNLLARFPDPNLYVVTLCETLAGVQLQIELLRVRQVDGRRVDNDILVRLANTQRRLLQDLSNAEPVEAEAEAWNGQ